MTGVFRRWPVLTICAAALAVASGPARAAVYEEFEVFAPPSGEVGAWEVDQHVNYGLRGRSRPEEPRALPTQGGVYLNTEINYSAASWYTLALELPVAVTRDGRLHDGGFKLRNIFGLGASGPWSFGLLLEAQRQPRGFLPQPWAFEADPLIAWRGRRWGAVLNLGFGATVGRRGAQSYFAPAAQVSYALSSGVSVAAEYYGDLGRVERWGPLSGQEHQVFGVAVFGLGGDVDLRLGIGRGLTPASDRWVGTVVLGFGF